MEEALDEDELDEELEDEDELELLDEDVDDVEDEALLDDDEVDVEDEEDAPPAPPQAANDSIKPNSSPFCFAPYIYGGLRMVDWSGGIMPRRAGGVCDPDSNRQKWLFAISLSSISACSSVSCLPPPQTPTPDSGEIHFQ